MYDTYFNIIAKYIKYFALNCKSRFKNFGDYLEILNEISTKGS